MNTGFDEKIYSRIRKPFQPHEDLMLKRAILMYPCGTWPMIASFIPNRTARQCRDRWMNYLRPDIDKNDWSLEEDILLDHMVHIYGFKWSRIHEFFPNRAYNDIKNRYYSKISKRKPGFEKDCLMEFSFEYFERCETKEADDILSAIL